MRLFDILWIFIILSSLLPATKKKMLEASAAHYVHNAERYAHELLADD